jgi:endonuclease-8
MPEGHTIHALAARLDRAFAGRSVAANSPQGRFAAEASQLDGLHLLGSEAVGKHLFVDFSDDLLLHVHLGLIGQFPVRPIGAEGAPSPIGAVRLRLVGESHVADLRGPMICALITPDRRDEVVGSLGPDPLDPRADGDRAWQRIQRSRKPIAELLMNQSFVAGVGNVYRCEILHRHALDPFTPGAELSHEAWLATWQDLVELLPLGVAFSQILTMDDQVEQARDLVEDGTAAEHSATLTGERLGDWFERRFHTYQRIGEPCLRCGTPIQARTVAGRTLYWCPGCQLGR